MSENCRVVNKISDLMKKIQVHFYMNTQESIIKIFLHINNIEHVYFNKLQFDMKIMRIGKKRY